MPQPVTRELLIAGPLANVSVQYRNKAYIADRVFRILDGVAPEAKIAKYLKGAWFRDEAGLRAGNGRAPRGGYPVDYIDIITKEYAFAKEVTEDDRLAVKLVNGPPLRPDQDAIEFCADRIDLKKERLTANIVLNSTWSGISGEDKEGKWAASEGASNNFIEDIETRIETIRSNTGLRPNVLLMSANTLKEIKMISGVLDRIKYTERGIVSAPLIAAMFELDEVIIGEAIYSTAKEKKSGTDFSAQSVWEKNAGKGSAFLFYRPSAPGLKVPSPGYQARTRFTSGLTRQTSTWREPAEHQDVYEVAEKVFINQVCADLGFLWYDTIQT